MGPFFCPVCKKKLTKAEYEKALGILDEREKRHEHQLADYERLLREERMKRRKARDEGIRFERARRSRLVAGLRAEAKKWQERCRQLEKGTTPQTEGLEFEDKLASRLRREFPHDDVQHKGQGGDVLHYVKFQDKVAGIIIYECKRTPAIQGQHIIQARLAKQTRQADFAILVTTGRRKRFGGIMTEDGVVIVAPLGVVSLAALLRTSLIEMLRAKITKEERARIAHRLMQYVTDTHFKNAIEEVIHVSAHLERLLKQEARDHANMWQKRFNLYQTINWDSSQIRDNVQLVIQGKEPKTLTRPKAAPLQLPAPREGMRKIVEIQIQK